MAGALVSFLLALRKFQCIHRVQIVIVAECCFVLFLHVPDDVPVKVDCFPSHESVPEKNLTKLVVQNLASEDTFDHFA